MLECVVFEWDVMNTKEIAKNNVKSWEAEQAAGDLEWCSLGWNETTSREAGIGQTDAGEILLVLVRFGEISRISMTRIATDEEVVLYENQKCEYED
jgi:uncharacterized DUF497 family protein